MKQYLIKLICLFSLITANANLSFGQKPDFIRTPNGPNTIVDWNVKFKTLIIPHGSTFTIAGAQDSTGHLRLRMAGDTTLGFYVKGFGWVPVANKGISYTKAQTDSIAALKANDAVVEHLANKQNSLNTDGTGVKYPTIDAVNTGLGLKLNLTGGTLTSNTYSSTNQGVFIGDSFTAGAPGPTTLANRYSTITANLTGATEVNYGIGSSTMQKGTPVNPIGGTNMQDRLSDIPTKTASQLYLVFQFGDNDFGYNGGNYDVNGFKTGYRVALNNALSKGWAAKDIYLLSPTYMTTTGFAFYASLNGGNTPTLARLLSYVQATSDISVEFGTNYIDLYQTMLNNSGVSLLYTDGLHANDAGARVIANALSSKIIENYSPLVIKDNQGNMLAAILNKAGVSGIKLGSSNIRSLISPTSIDLGGTYNTNANDPINAKLKIVSNSDGVWGLSADFTDGLAYFSGSGKHKMYGNLNVTGNTNITGTTTSLGFISSNANWNGSVGGTFDVNYNTGFGGPLRYWGGTTNVKFLVDNSGNGAFAGDVTATQYRLSALNSPVLTSISPGTYGEIRWTADYMYLCVATNTWVRVALATW